MRTSDSPGRCLAVPCQRTARAGCIPEELKTLANLRTLTVEGNQLTGKGIVRRVSVFPTLPRSVNRMCESGY